MLVIVHDKTCDCASCRHVHTERVRVREMLRAERKSRARWVPHIACNGARFHVLWWDSRGTHCSEPRCEYNRPRKRQVD